MLSFESDYTEGACEEILRRLIKTNYEQCSGYGNDRFSISAKEKIKKACQKEDAEVFLIAGGTQTNQLVIDTVLDSCEGVISADTGHVSAHEAGAVEFTGHKVLTVPNYEGKIKAKDVRALIERFYADESFDHMVFPGMVYISHPTEYGTLYTKEELKELSDLCKEKNIPLYMDGARLGYALASSSLSLPEIASLCDIFYIGGTKVGALLGEAVVFSGIKAPKNLFTKIKQHGALLAKGRVIGIQFDTLFTDNLYYRLGEHAIRQADKMRAAFKEKGYEFFIETVTNQIFVKLSDEKLKKLREKVACSFWEKPDENNTVVRFASSWATTDEAVETLCSLL